ncbi:MAG TPA: ABC transporter substrate-binding protein [Ohtaekwangia sp.]|nr:ABC transporter substrate-binding protein [Ohtaekwangia sp.]
MKQVIFALIVLTVACCQQKKEKISSVHSDHLAEERVSLKYATGFSITRKSGSISVTVNHPFQGAGHSYTYLLVPRHEQVPQHHPDVKVIRTPLNSIVCTSTTHIPLLDYLNESEKLVGFPTTDFISSKNTRKLIDAGKVQDLGIDKGINLELLASLQPDMVMAYAMNADYGQFKKMEDMNIPVVINAEYLENHPLGRAEWIKFMALFFDKEAEADSVFQTIEQSYLNIKSLAETQSYKPSVMSGIIYGDAWFMPGGQNYASTILKDAACHYLWAGDSSNGFLELNFETVYEKANNADLWIGVGMYSSLAGLAAGDHRYTQFASFKKGKIYNYDARMGAKGGNEFLELGYLRPDIILQDLVKIAHPELLPDYTPYFYRKLE